MAVISQLPQSVATVNYAAILQTDRKRCEQITSFIEKRARALQNYCDKLNANIFSLSWKTYLARWICCYTRRHEYRPLEETDTRLKTIQALATTIPACGPIFAFCQKTRGLYEELYNEFPSPKMNKTLKDWELEEAAQSNKSEKHREGVRKLCTESRHLRESMEWLLSYRSESLKRLARVVSWYEMEVKKFTHLLDKGYRNLAYTSPDRSVSCCSRESDSEPDELFPFTTSAPYLREALTDLKLEEAALPNDLALFQEELPPVEKLDSSLAEVVLTEKVERMKKMLAEEETAEISRRTLPLVMKPIDAAVPAIKLSDAAVPV